MCSAWTEIKPEIKHKVFTQEAGAGGVRVGWLELEQSNSAFEMNLLRLRPAPSVTDVTDFCAKGAAAAGGSNWRQQPGRQQLAATARETIEACDTSVGVFPRDREAQEAGSRHALGTGNRRGGQKFPGRREWQGAAGSSLALGAARDMPRRACLPKKRGKQGAAGRVAEASRGGAIHHRVSSNI